MGRVRLEALSGLRVGVVGFAAVGAAIIVSGSPADARYHRYVRTYHRPHVEAYAPPAASIVVDGNTGTVLHASNAEASRHPASLTKIMTLYLLFERLDVGRINLDSPLKISEHAAEQDPTKLDLKPGSTLRVEDAIKAVVTKSANDAAVAIAENLGGSEDQFAKLMTEKAHALGMAHTTYVNASGLPDDDQITTAQDQALLGRAIQERFPHYYKYFSTEEFVYHGHAIRNHNHLLGVVGGVDGIKTGYTRASGFNLVTSVHRDGRYIVAVVLGGRSAGERDAHMRELINEHIKEASLHHTAPAIAERPAAHETKIASAERVEPKAMAFVKAPLASAHTDPAPAAMAKTNNNATVGTSDPIQPLLVRTIPYRTAPVQAGALGPMPALVSAAPGPQPIASIPVRPSSPAPSAEATSSVFIASAAPAPIATAPKTDAATIAAPAKVDSPKLDASTAEPTKADSAKAEPAKLVAKSEPIKEEPPPPHVHTGWQIQIGAFEGEDEAKQHLSEAQSKIPAMLSKADRFTERVQKGDKALYRARFAGFDKATAEAACRQLKHSDIACMTVKD
jgi:D-alanyl-D-alanine carboxypeptidase